MSTSIARSESLCFHTPELVDAAWIRELTQSDGTKGCEASVGYLLMWRHAFDFQVARFENLLLIRFAWDGRYHYFFPLGKGEKETALKAIEKEEGGKPIFFGVRPEKLPLMETVFAGHVEAEEERSAFDYIYNAEALATLPGKLYHGKKNHISWFEKNYSWRYEAISQENLTECKGMLAEWEKENLEKDPEGLSREHQGLLYLLDHFTGLSLEGGLLRADGRVVAFTLGDALNREVFCTHAEKAFSDVRGAYPMINREFARYLWEKGYRLINREEDDGVEGLRKAKLSYHPAILLEKYRVIVH